MLPRRCRPCRAGPVGQGHSTLPATASAHGAALQQDCLGHGARVSAHRVAGLGARATRSGRTGTRTRNGVTPAFALAVLSLLMRTDGVIVNPLLELPPNNAIYGGQNEEFPLGVVLTRDDPSILSADINEAGARQDCKQGAPNGVCAEVQLNTGQRGKTSFVVSTKFSYIENDFGTGDAPPLQAGEDTCLDEDVAIRLFKKHYLLECDKACSDRENVWFNVMQEFAGVPEYEAVLTRGFFPAESCLLGSDFKGTSTFDEMAAFLKDLSYITPDLDPTLCSDPGSMSDLGCDKLAIGVTLKNKENEGAGSATITAEFSKEFPNLPPILKGHPGFDRMETGAEKKLPAFELIEPDADIVVLILETTAMIRLTNIKAPAKVDRLQYETPEYEPQFLVGAFNTTASHVEVRCTVEQAQRALRSLYFRSETLGRHNLTIAVNDEGNTGYPARGDFWKTELKFSFDTMPSLKPPSIEVINSDEAWRLDWRPGVRYLRGGVEVGIDDDLFPCGGDTVFGLYYFPLNGSSAPPTRPGWRGELPPGDGSESDLKRNCRLHPDTFWKDGEKAIYATLDEGGKARVYVQMDTAPSGCNETQMYKVTLAITNANNSRMNLPVAKVDGYHMDWFECRDGAWYCKNRHPMITLDNSNGARDRLSFHYDQIHRHLSDGIQDYRMTFTGTHADITAAISNVTVEFPWLDQNYKITDELHEPWPFKTWPRTGRSLLGSNILRMTIEDIPAEYTYDEKDDVMWTVQGAYSYARLTKPEAKTACDQDPTCYGFQFLENSQLVGIVEQQQISSIGIGASAGQPWLQPDLPYMPALGFSDRPPTIFGLGDTTWDDLFKQGTEKDIDWSTITPDNLPNTFFFREAFDRFDIQPYRYNAMTYTKKEYTRICLGTFPKTERLLDIRVIELPINQPPLLTAQKPFWRIQKAYEFPVPGIRLYDGDATWMGNEMEVSFIATRGFFTAPDTSGLTFLQGSGTVDEFVQTFRCLYKQCQRAIREVRYKSAEVPGTDMISLIVNDRGNSGELGALSATISIVLSLAAGPYNIPPIVQIPGLPARVAHPGQRVDISGIYVEDIDLDKPRWDKPYAQGYMTVIMSIGRGYFDVTRLRRRGLLNSLILGTADGTPDDDCPCRDGDTCPCNHWVLTKYSKFSGLREDVKWAVAEVSVYLDLERPDLNTAQDTTLVITVDDNCNTGFSDDSGVQKPCLRDTDSVVIRIQPRPAEQAFLYVSPRVGVDTTTGTFMSVLTDLGSETGRTQAQLNLNASSEDGIYEGLHVKITAGKEEGEMGEVMSYNGTARSIVVVFKPGVIPDNSSRYEINCGVKKLPCRSLKSILKETREHSRVLAMPGIYSGPDNMGLDFTGRTLLLRSTHGYNDTVIDCEGTSGPIAVFSPTGRAQVYIDGFSIRNCLAKDGGAFVFRYVKASRVARVDAQGADSSKCTGKQDDGDVLKFGGERCRATPLIRNCYFYNNLASGFGGAVYIKDGNPRFESCIFFSNSANSGGAVYIRGGYPSFKGCSFYSNAAQLGGGAMIINGGRVSVEQCTFEINAATRAGGAISMTAGSMEMIDSSVKSNYAGEADGGVFISGGEASFQGCVQDANSIGQFASEVLDEIQARRQQTSYGSEGFAEAYRYVNPLAIT